jgi:hypothetical protein
MKKKESKRFLSVRLTPIDETNCRRVHEKDRLCRSALAVLDPTGDPVKSFSLLLSLSPRHDQMVSALQKERELRHQLQHGREHDQELSL